MNLTNYRIFVTMKSEFERNDIMKMPEKEHVVLFFKNSKKECFIITQEHDFQKYTLYEAEEDGSLVKKVRTAASPLGFSECGY